MSTSDRGEAPGEEPPEPPEGPRDAGAVAPARPRSGRLRLHIDMAPQPDDATCGPTCLSAVYAYFGDPAPLEDVIEQVTTLEEGGTLAVLLGIHALARGYEARLFTFNLRVFDPTWFAASPDYLVERLNLRLEDETNAKRRLAGEAYREYLAQGGELRFEDLTAALIRKYLKRGLPILTGLSATYLYRTPRERGTTKLEWDDIHGEPQGHFVVLAGYDAEERQVLVSDPYRQNPFGESHEYWVDVDRLVNAILIGVLTYDANLLILRPGGSERRTKDT